MPQWVMRGEGGSGKRPQGGSYSCHSNRSLTRICKEEDAAAAADGDEEKRLGIVTKPSNGGPGSVLEAGSGD